MLQVKCFSIIGALDQIDKGELIYKNATSSPNSRRNPNSSPVHVKSSAPVTPVIALYNYAARTEEELSFFEGIAYIVRKYVSGRVSFKSTAVSIVILLTLYVKKQLFGTNKCQLVSFVLGIFV